MLGRARNYRKHRLDIRDAHRQCYTDTLNSSYTKSKITRLQVVIREEADIRTPAPVHVLFVRIGQNIRENKTQ